MKFILIALAVAVIISLAVIGLWFTVRVFRIAKSQVKLSKSIDAGDLDAVRDYFEDYTKRHNKGMKS